jgi:hypothetical protein
MLRSVAYYICRNTAKQTHMGVSASLQLYLLSGLQVCFMVMAIAMLALNEAGCASPGSGTAMQLKN